MKLKMRNLILWVVLFTYFQATCGEADPLEDVYASLGTGDFTRVVSRLTEVLSEEPFDAEAHYIKGIAHYGLRSLMDAEKEFKETIRLNPTVPDFHVQLASLYHDTLRLSDAHVRLTLAKQAALLQGDPREDVDSALVNLERTMRMQGHRIPTTEVSLFEETNPWHLLRWARHLSKKGQTGESLEKMRKSAELFDESCKQEGGKVCIQYGSVLKELAITYDILAESPNDEKCQLAVRNYILSTEYLVSPMEQLMSFTYAGQVASRMGNQHEALGYLQQAVALNTTVTESSEQLFHLPLILGFVYLGMREYDTAALYLQNAVDLKPDCVPCYNNLAIAFSRANKKEPAALQKSLEYLERAVALEPNNSALLLGYSFTLSELGRRMDAFSVLKRGREIATDDDDCIVGILSFMLAIQRDIKDWQHWKDDRAHMLRVLEYRMKEELQIRKVDLGFFLIMEDRISANLEHELVKYIAQDVVREGRDIPVQLSPARDWVHNGKIRIGYSSFDFQPEHPVGHLTRGIYSRHDRSRIEVFCYDLHNANEVNSVIGSCDHVVDMSSYSPRAMADRITGDRLDVYVDLNGFTHGGRPELLVARMAPIQIQYIGYLGTLGMESVDYVLTDRVTSPPEFADTYAEKFLYTDYAFLSNEHATLFPVSDDPEHRIAKRRTEGLPQDDVVFGAFNALTKIEPAVWDMWCHLLDRVGSSVLLMPYKIEQAPGYLSLEARARGVPESRLLFKTHVSKKEFINLVGAADIFLDTPTRGAGATAVDALWGGVPMLTLPGEKMTNRLGAGMVTAMGTPDLIVASYKEYEDVAAAFVHSFGDPNPDDVRERILARRSSPMFDSSRWVKGYDDLIWRTVTGEAV